MGIERNNALRLIAVLLASFAVLITAKQVGAEINAPSPQNA
jgi:hypothetical protein